MTRKRFKKLMMAKGYSRDTAEYLADGLPIGKSYEEYYKEIPNWSDLIQMCKTVTEAASKTLNRILDSMAPALENIAKAAADVFEKFSSALPGLPEPSELPEG